MGFYAASGRPVKYQNILTVTPYAGKYIPRLPAVALAEAGITQIITNYTNYLF